MLTQVGKYQIVEKIGVGGFGTVYKGRDPFIKRAVAIKTCQSEEEEIKKRFFREAEFAGNLHHRNVTTIYDFGVTEDGTPYIVQEFLTGDDLDKAIKKKVPLSLARKLQILVDVCDGLGYAHSTGIIHRDIKPSNIRILEDGSVKIMDFGIAKSLVSQSTLTQTGITLGTASYLAPEQIRGEDLDARTDIFSLGVLAYEMLTGQKPFTGDHISTVLYKIMNEPPAPPSSLDPALPHGLDAMILKALEKDRTRRFSSCAEMRVECLALLQSVPEGHAFQMPESDMEKTVATPTSGIPNTASVSPRTPTGGRASRVLDTPLAPATPKPAPGGIGDVRLHTDTGVVRAVPAREEGGGSALALKVFAAAGILLAVAGGAWYVVHQRRSAIPAVPTPAPVPTAAPAPTAPPEPTPTAVPEPTVAVKEVPTAAVVTFKSNIYAELSINGKKHPSSLPAATRVTLKPGRYVAVFDAPGFTKVQEEFEIPAANPVPLTITGKFPPRAILSLTARPAGAEIRIDGVLVGPSSGTPIRKTLRAGPHEISVSLAGYRTEARSVDLKEDDVYVLPAIELKKE
ncbi:MAG TPA: serine/threonine-protein kinase [Thermoanaerobaculia bacterium]|jgi:serine/threonine-protein kinase|nr:serine/threonine-protein kinase [Thermoanaerobaculia bacterium]